MKKILFNVLIFFFIIFPLNTYANEKVNVYLFYSESCLFCHKFDLFMNELLKDRSDINYYKYEISRDENAYNRILLDKMNNHFNFNSIAFPLVIIGNEYRIGYNQNMKEEYLSLINFYKNNNYLDEAGVILGTVEENNYKPIDKPKEYKIKTMFGTIDIKELSLPLIAIIIGFTDGFNPCAMWILLFLISMMLTINDKKKSYILGFTFLFTSGFIYFIFMMAWLKVTDYINNLRLLQLFIGIIAILFGIYQLFNYYKTRKKSGCTVIKKEKRLFIINHIKKIIHHKSLFWAIIGIIILAILVNLVELICSMGLPVMFIEILSLNNLSHNKYLLYVIIYLFFFMIDDITIFLISMFTLKETAISTKYNKYSHLIGGIIILIIGLLIILKPEWLSFNF